MSLIGAGLAGTLLALVVVLAWWVWRRPFIGLGVLVAGMGLHSFVLMVLIDLGTPSVLVRAYQGWKELLIAVLTAAVLVRAWRMRRAGLLQQMVPADWVAIGLAIFCVVYFLIPGSILHSGANLAQRLVGFRVAFLIPLMYFLGRSIRPDGAKQVATVLWLCLGAGAVIAVLGVIELRFVPTATWLDWGVNRYTAFLGFTYHGPKGLPENFFVTLPDGTLLRRMVSSYISPLGIAYTGILLFPIGFALLEHYPPRSRARLAAGVALAVMTAGVFLAVTRFAILALIGEAVVLFLITRRRWLAVTIPILIAATVVILFPYASIGPSVDRDLVPVVRTQWVWAVSGNDTSANEHYSYLIRDIKVDLEHPLGLGTGAATVRYGQLVGTGESAVLGIFGDLGLAGGALYVALYVLGLWKGFRSHLRLSGRPLDAALPLVAWVGGLGLLPVTMTSDVWGDLSVTFLFWWAVGASVTLALVPAPESSRRIAAVEEKTGAATPG